MFSHRRVHLLRWNGAPPGAVALCCGFFLARFYMVRTPQAVTSGHRAALSNARRAVNRKAVDRRTCRPQCREAVEASTVERRRRDATSRRTPWSERRGPNAVGRYYDAVRCCAICRRETQQRSQSCGTDTLIAGRRRTVEIARVVGSPSPVQRVTRGAGRSIAKAVRATERHQKKLPA